MNKILLSTAYLPSINYLIYALKYDVIILEKSEFFVKQSFRNRTEILTSNGKLSLSIPIVKQIGKELISEIKISYAEDWQKQHWRAITSSYKNSPYFEYFEHEFKPFYENKFEFLFDYNTQLLKTVLEILRVKKQVDFTSHFELAHFDIHDLRELSDVNYNDEIIATPYYQVFGEKFGFTPKLSCLDALFNIGLDIKNLPGVHSQ
jgi:hypothetical protein